MRADRTIDDLATFVQASPTSYHAVAEVVRRLTRAGFTELDETGDWTEFVAPGVAAYVVRDGAVIAFTVPTTARATTPFRILGAHTDSPGFRLKPGSFQGPDGWMRLGVEIYGGPILASWFDRELLVAGRIVDEDGQEHLVRTPPIARIPHLAIHLDRGVNEGFAPDRQRDVQPIIGIGTEDPLDVVAAAAGIDPASIAGADLFLADSAAPQRFGADAELFASPRLDNLVSVHAGVSALLAADEGDAIPLLAAFDHEELGSASRSGASGPFLADVLERITAALGGDRGAHARALAGSWCLSADAGHGVHPNRGEKHDPRVRPRLGDGPLLKINANQRYTTDAHGEALWRRACAAADVPFQPFVSNNAVPCGSTIGPLTATRLGIRTLDVGVPLLSMHSARELCHVDDPARLSAASQQFFQGA